MDIASYLLIAEMPERDMRDVILWNPCQGPYYVRIIRDFEVEDYRTDGIFSHFMVIPRGTDQMRKEHNSMMRDRGIYADDR